MFDWAKKIVNKAENAVGVSSTFTSVETPIEQQDVDPKILAESNQVLAGMTDLAARLGSSSAMDEAMDRNLQRLRQEGSGQ